MGVVDTIDRDKTNRAERLLFALFIPWLAIVFLSETTLTYSYPETFDSVLSLLKSTLLPLSIVLINLFLINKDSIIRKLMLLTVVLLLTSQCLLLTFNDDLLLCACLVIGMQGIDFKKILKTYLWESISLLLLTTVLAICGIIPNATFHHQGVKRYALGAYWGTDYSAKVFFLLLIVLYLYSSRLKIYHWLGLLAVSILVFVFTYGKMDLICMILAIIVFFIHEKISSRGVCREKGSSDRACSKWSCFWQKISPLASPLAAFLMTILTLLFSTGSSFILKLATSQLGESGIFEYRHLRFRSTCKVDRHGWR